MLKIDIHTHIIPRTLPRWAERFGYGGFIHLDHYAPEHPKHRPEGFAAMMSGDRFFRDIEANCWDADVRIAEYARSATQVQVVCTIPVLFAYHAKPADGLAVAQFLNDDIAATVAKHPQNYIGLGTLPMQDPDLAVAELERCKHTLGLAGIQIGSNINRLNLHEPRFDVLWEACERLDMPVLVHPWEMMGEADMPRYWLPWLVGMPAETTRALCSMMFGGVFDRFPKLRVCFSHAGGSFFGTFARIQHGFDCRPDLVAIDNPNPPRDYLHRFWIDCVTHDTRTLQFIIDMIGTERICLGSDYPFPLGDLTIGAFLDTMPLSNTDRENILHRAAQRWLGQA